MLRAVETTVDRIWTPVVSCCVPGYKKRLYALLHFLRGTCAQLTRSNFTQLSPTAKSIFTDIKLRLYTYCTRSITTINLYKYKEELV